MEAERIIELSHVNKVYHMGNEIIKAVDDVSFSIVKGEFCCLLGTSGSGKSTLLNLMAGIETVTSGKVLIKGKNIPKMNENRLAKFRQCYLGFVFQAYNLIPTMTALENVELPLVFKRVPVKKRRKLAKDMLKKVGLGNRLSHKPKEMSGGQQQRVGIARAFVAKPEIVFADEPTGNLDTKTTKEVMDLIKRMARENKQTIVMVTHDPSLAAYADKVIRISDGRIQSIEYPWMKSYEMPKKVQPESKEAPEEEVPAKSEDASEEEVPVMLPEEPEEAMEPERCTEPEDATGSEQPEEPEEAMEPERCTEPEDATESEQYEEPAGEVEPEQTTDTAEPVKPVLVKKIVVKKIKIKELYQGNRKGTRG